MTFILHRCVGNDVSTIRESLGERNNRSSEQNQIIWSTVVSQQSVQCHYKTKHRKDIYTMIELWQAHYSEKLIFILDKRMILVDVFEQIYLQYMNSKKNGLNNVVCVIKIVIQITRIFVLFLFIILCLHWVIPLLLYVITRSYHIRAIIT